MAFVSPPPSPFFLPPSVTLFRSFINVSRSITKVTNSFFCLFVLTTNVRSVSSRRGKEKKEEFLIWMNRRGKIDFVFSGFNSFEIRERIIALFFLLDRAFKNSFSLMKILKTDIDICLRCLY